MGARATLITSQAAVRGASRPALWAPAGSGAAGASHGHTFLAAAAAHVLVRVLVRASHEALELVVQLRRANGTRGQRERQRRVGRGAACGRRVAALSPAAAQARPPRSSRPCPQPRAPAACRVGRCRPARSSHPAPSWTAATPAHSGCASRLHLQQSCSAHQDGTRRVSGAGGAGVGRHVGTGEAALRGCRCWASASGRSPQVWWWCCAGSMLLPAPASARLLSDLPALAGCVVQLCRHEGRLTAPAAARGAQVRDGTSGVRTLAAPWQRPRAACQLSWLCPCPACLANAAAG